MHTRYLLPTTEVFPAVVAIRQVQLLYGNAGIRPYTYNLDGITYQPSNTFTNPGSGNYTGYVKDAGGCVGTKPNIVIGSAAPLVVLPYVRQASSCNADNLLRSTEQVVSGHTRIAWIISLTSQAIYTPWPCSRTIYSLCERF